ICRKVPELLRESKYRGAPWKEQRAKGTTRRWGDAAKIGRGEGETRGHGDVLRWLCEISVTNIRGTSNIPVSPRLPFSASVFRRLPFSASVFSVFPLCSLPFALCPFYDAVRSWKAN